MDRELYKYTAEREGNDAWLRYRLTVGYDFDQPVVRLDENHSGWAGKITESRQINLDKVDTAKISAVVTMLTDWCNNDKGLFAEAVQAINKMVEKPILLHVCEELKEKAGNRTFMVGIFQMVDEASSADIIMGIASQYADVPGQGEVVFGEDLMRNLNNIAWSLKSLN